MSLLEIKDLTMRFGGLVAVNKFQLNLNEGEIVGLIGPNGSGKTTIFNMITGFYKPTAGHIYFAGKEITGFRPDQVSQAGISRIFQNNRLFRNLSVLDNVMIGHHQRLTSNPFAAILRTRGYQGEEKKAYDDTINLLTGLGLVDYLKEPAGKLPYGLQRRLEVARALSTKPHLILLDEPATGMNPEETTEMMDFIIRVRRYYSLTILLIEHTMRVVMGVCERMTVLNYGQVISEGKPDEIQNNKVVIEAYLGVKHASKG